MIKERHKLATVPERYIYETVDGKPIYYKGWKQALIREIETGKPQEMGSNTLQGRLIMAIAGILFKAGVDDDYTIVGSEMGLHLGTNDNRCLDLALFDKDIFKDSKNYADFPPKVVIEVDIQADLGNWEGDEAAYYRNKTEDLLNFGVERVLWIFTENKQVLVVTSTNDWQTVSFDTPVEVIDGKTFTVSELM